MIANKSRFRKERKFFLGRLLLFLLVFGFLVILVWLNLGITQKRGEVKEEKSFLEIKKEQLESDKREFLGKISEASGEAYLEKVAREDLNLKKEGETVVAFPVSEELEEETSSPPVKDKSFWQIFLEKIGLKKRQ